MTRRVRHAHRPSRWLQAIEAASFLFVLALIVVVVPLLWAR